MTELVANEETNRLISSDRVEGTKVYNPAGEKLGTVKNFMVDKRTGKAEYAVMEFGGLLGIGSDYYPLPWEMLDYDPKQGGYVVDIDESKLRGAPTYDERQTAFDRAYGQAVYGHFGLIYP